MESLSETNIGPAGGALVLLAFIYVIQQIVRQ